MRRPIWAVTGPVAVLCTLLSACGGEVSEGVSWQGTMVDSAGVTLVLNPPDGLWTEGDRWRVVEELRIGELAGDPELQFGRVGSMAVNSRGEMFVVDRQVPTIRVFDADGDFVRRIGAAGSGPGEFAPAVNDVFVGQGDTLLVPDVRNRRIHRFAPDGTFLDDTRIDAAAGRPLRFRWNPSAGHAVVQLRPSVTDSEVIPADELRVVRPDGSFGEVLLEIPSGGLFAAGEGITYFTPEPAWTITDSLTVLHGVNDRYRIGVYGRDGSLDRVITMPHEPREITDRDIRAFFAYLDARWLALGVLPSRLQQNRDRVAFAETFPAYFQFFTGPRETVWVQPVRPPGEMSDEEIERYDFVEDFGASEWEVFDRDGRFLGGVTMPPRFQPRLFVDDRIYGVIRDDFDVPYVARMRIETGVAR